MFFEFFIFHEENSFFHFFSLFFIFFHDLFFLMSTPFGISGMGHRIRGGAFVSYIVSKLCAPFGRE